MANYKNQSQCDEDFFNGDPYSRQMYWEKYCDNPGYFHQTAPSFALRYPAVGRRNYDRSSSVLDPRNRKQSSSISKSRIAITVAVVVTICAIIAAVIVAVYFTSIPDKRAESEVIIRKMEVTRLKTYQGEVGLVKEWNENLTDPASPVYKQEANNFISAMDQLYGKSPEKDRYYSTVVDGFRSGSIVVKCRILFIGTYIQEIDPSAKSNNGQEGKVISETEINPMVTANLIKLIKDELPDLLGTNLTATPELQLMKTTNATATTQTLTTAAPKSTKSATDAPATEPPRTVKQELSTDTTDPVTTKTNIIKETTTTMTTTLTTAATTSKSSTTITSITTSTPPTAATTSMSSTISTTKETSTLTTTTRTVVTKPSTTLQPITSLKTLTPTTTTTTTPKSTITSTSTTTKATNASTTTTPKPTITSITTPPSLSTSTTIVPKPTNISSTTPNQNITNKTATSKPTTTVTPELTTAPNTCDIFDLEVRLSHQMYHYGRVEIRCRNSSSEWGTICDDMWDELDAKVVCRHLGYLEDTEAYSYRGAYFGQGSGPIIINRVDCRGDEQYLSNCTSQRGGNIHCTHVQDAGVSCGTYKSSTKEPPTRMPANPNYTTTATTSGGIAVRIVDGPSCIMGRVEIWYEGQWGRVCDSGWSSRDAQVICRMLGYRTTGASTYVQKLYGEGTGPFVLDNVACTGFESSIADCPHGGWGNYQCEYEGEALVSCEGSERQCMVRLSVNCDFGIYICGYTTTAVSGSSLWSIGNVNGIKSVPSISLPNSNTKDKGVGFYLNRDGLQTDEAYLQSPTFALNTSTTILEFYYWINASTDGALRLEVKGRELWKSQVLRSEEEGEWMYQCASLDQIMPETEQSVSFYAKRGRNRFRIIAVDNIELKEGTCKYGLEDAMCDFEHPSVHGYSIDCTSCRYQIPMFRWYWGHGKTQSNGTGPHVDHTYGTVAGHYMYTESSYGEEGNSTTLTFPTVSTEMTFKGLQFYYHMYGRHIGTLRVMLEYNGQKEVVWEESGNQGNQWKKACTLLPENSNVKISFIAIRGPGPYGDIAVDDIELITEYCQHPITCMDDFQKCGYTRSSQSEGFMWNWNGDLYDGMGAAAEDQLAVLRSPTFQHTGRAQYLTFYHQIPTTDRIKTKFLNYHDGRETLLSSLSSITDGLELACINLPQVTANSSISFEAIRGDSSMKDSKHTAIRNVEIKYGYCPDTLDVHNCTFEAEHALCSHNITSSVTPSCDQPVYMWMRHSGATWTNRTGPDFDHTFMMKEMNRSFASENMTGKGHYMYVDASVGSPGDTSTLALKDFVIGKFCSLRFFYHIYGKSTPVLRVRETMRHIDMGLPSFDLNTWIPGCMELKNDCTVEESTVRSVSFVAERGYGPYGDIAIDDISLSLQKCQDTSINDTFAWETTQTGLEPTPTVQDGGSRPVIESIRLMNGSSEYSGRLEVLVNGTWGTICDESYNLNFLSAATFCFELGFSYNGKWKHSSYYGVGPRTLISSIKCSPGERDLDNCTVKFNSYCLYRYQRNMGLDCVPADPSCNFRTSACDYHGDKWYRTFDEENIGYMSTYAQEGELSELMSPWFTSKTSRSITFMYKVSKWTSGKYMLSVDDGTNRTALWQLDGRKHEGIFRDCVDLRSFNGVNVQLVFSVETGQPLNTTQLTTHGIFDITYDLSSCQGVFPAVVCTFESIIACPFVVTCNEVDSYRFQIKSGPSHSYFTGPQADYTTQNYTGHYMIADASYGEEGNSADFKISVTVQPHQYYLRYRYYMSGSNVGSLQVYINDEDRAASFLVDERYGDQGNSWNLACSVLPSTGLSMYDIVFTATRGNGTQGDIAIDDIELNHRLCPYPASCDFERPRYCDYSISQTAYHWQGDYLRQQNGIPLATDNYMRTSLYNGSEGDVAEMRSPSFSLSVDTKCISFAFILFGEGVGSLSVSVVYNNDVAQRKHGFFVAGNQESKWYQANVILEYANSTYKTAAIVFSAQRGSSPDSFIGLDNIEISSEKCVFGIQDEICVFNHPYLCGLQSNCTDGSRYQWQIYHGASLANGTGASWDADHDSKGSYLTVDSSYGMVGDVSYAWFPPVHTSSTTKLIFDYLMYGRNEDFENLTVLFETQSGLTTLDQLCCNRGNIWIFKCLPLPANAQGTVYFKATGKDGIFGDISLDNVGLIEEHCPIQSVTCDFDADKFNCGYRGWGKTSTNKNHFMALSDPVGTNILHSPFAVYEGPACVAFNYKALLNQNNELRTQFKVIVRFEMTSGEQSEKSFRVKEVSADDWQSTQIQIPDQNNVTRFWVEFVAYDGRGYFAVDNVMLKPGECPLPTCAADKFACIEKCIPIEMECNKKMDCENGRDEKVSCKQSISCDFDTDYHCGYKNTSYDALNAGWAWISYQTLDTWNVTGYIVDERNKNGHFLMATLYNTYDVITVESPNEYHAEEKCLRFSYFGNGLLKIGIIGGLEWSIVEDAKPFMWRKRQINIPIGDASVQFQVKVPWNQRDSIPVISGIDNIHLLDGPCVSNKINCSGDLLPCPDNSRCIQSSQICDKINDCHDGSDEKEDLCPGSMACQFEDIYQCRYTNLQPSASWYQRSGNFFKLPKYDHTYGNLTGRFMVAYNYSDLVKYYNDISFFWGLDYPYRLEYLTAILSSPREHFTTESCAYFYYYLNGTAVRPNPLSSQLFVYVNGSSGRSLAWYDHVNRTVNGWLKGWVPLKPGNANIIFEAKTVTTTTIWPGVVALDDVSVISGHCPAYPDCGPDTFRCTTTRVCIAVDMQCDGGNDCVDGSDEENCISKPDYQVKLINGDGSYGSIAIFYQGLWRPVCMSKYRLMEGNSTIVQLACKKIGYTGRFQGAFVNSWHQPVQYAMEVSCSYKDVDISSCKMTLTRTEEITESCYYFQAAFCSNDECFSGEKLCPPDTNNSFSTKCISHRYFCDGIPDCPSGTDELNCANCSASEFECTNHECVPASQRCDGIPQCGDKSDEFGCVIVTNAVSQIYHSQLSVYLPVCYNNMNRILADMLCSLSGQGTSTHYESYTYGQGTVLTPQSNSATSLVPGYAVSVEPCYSVLIKCASIECGTTIFDDSRLPKILHGRDAVLGQLPWQIALYKSEFFACGGSIIHPNWVLTAAHCIKMFRSYSVRVGVIDVGSRTLDGNQGHVYNTSRTHVHPYYNKDSDNDISLLYFSQPIVFNDYVRPICIASRRTVEEMLNAGYNAECYASGWGDSHNYINRERTKFLQMVRVYLYKKEECDQIYYNLNDKPPQNITVCVDNQNLGSPTCMGDSGGPLICRNKYGRFELLGTLSFGHKSCFLDGYPDIYQLSYFHADWIEQITGMKFSDLTIDND